jgi:hypothetical protein
MSISADTWAIVLATAAGPIGAVVISLWREARSAKRGRRLHVFRTLMSTRRLGISQEHVNALNLVEVDFYKCRKVQEEWKSYKEHLFAGGDEDVAWQEKKERLLANLLYQIARTLGFDIPALEIFKGGYAPKGWLHLDLRRIAALEYIYELSEGSKSVPICVVGVNQPQQPAQAATVGQQTSTREPEHV